MRSRPSIRLSGREGEDRHEDGRRPTPLWRLQSPREDLDRLAVEHAPIGMALLDLDGKFTRVNAALCRIVGYSADELSRLTFVDITHRDDLDADLELVAQLNAGVIEGYELDKRYVRSDGASVDVTIHVTLARRSDGTPLQYIAQVQDVSEQRRAQRALRESEARYRRIFETASEGIVSLDADERIVVVNDRLCEMLDFSRAELTGRRFASIAASESRGVLESMAMRDGDDLRPVDCRLERRDGRAAWATISLRVDRDEEGVLTGAFAMVSDVTARRVAETALHALSITDDLTQLHNRRGFVTLAEQHLRVAARQYKPAVLFFYDLDGLKIVNDRFGHESGDRALCVFADALKQSFRESDLVGRLGGDEFVALAIDTDARNAARMTERLDRRILAASAAGQVSTALSASIGCAEFDPAAPASLSALLALADSRMYEQKRRRVVDPMHAAAPITAQRARS